MKLLCFFFTWCSNKLEIRIYNQNSLGEGVVESIPSGIQLGLGFVFTVVTVHLVPLQGVAAPWGPS